MSDKEIHSVVEEHRRTAKAELEKPLTWTMITMEEVSRKRLRRFLSSSGNRPGYVRSLLFFEKPR